MTDEKKPEGKSLPMRLKETFHKPDQKLQDFMAEIKQLTEKDKEDFRRWFNEIGLPVI